MQSPDENREEPEGAPDLGVVYKAFGFANDEDCVLNVYLGGSRVYGTSELTSDW